MICAFCGSQTSGKKFCNCKCQRAEHWKRRKARKLQTNPRPEKQCVVCGEIVPANRHATCTVCSAACSVKAQQAYHQKRWDRIKAKKPERLVVCRCGKEFKTRYLRQKTCGTKVCKAIRRREEYRERLKEPAIRQKPILDNRVKAKKTSVNKIPYEIVKAKCPGCGVMHDTRVEVAWIGNGTPRIKCNRYPVCINTVSTYEASFMHLNLPTSIASSDYGMVAL